MARSPGGNQEFYLRHSGSKWFPVINRLISRITSLFGVVTKGGGACKLVIIQNIFITLGVDCLFSGEQQLVETEFNKGHVSPQSNMHGISFLIDDRSRHPLISNVIACSMCCHMS